MADPAIAAKNAAHSAMLRSCPPVTKKLGQLVKHKSPGRGPEANAAATALRAGFASGNGNGMIKRSRRRNALSSAERRFGEQGDAVRFHPLKQVAHFDVGVAVVAVFDFWTACQTVRPLHQNRSTARPLPLHSKTGAQVLSVSPMYLLTICDKSM